MVQLLLQEVDEHVVRGLARQAAEHGRSLDEEVREIPSRAVRVDRSRARALAAEFHARYPRREGPSGLDVLQNDRSR